jgi:hypothetical protein
MASPRIFDEKAKKNRSASAGEVAEVASDFIGSSETAGLSEAEAGRLLDLGERPAQAGWSSFHQPACAGRSPRILKKEPLSLFSSGA